MVQLQVEAEKLHLSCNILPTGLASEGIKLSNLWIQLAHETKGLIAQDYLQGTVDEAGLLQLEVHRLGINELGRYRLIVKYSYESPERSAEGRTKYECILPAFEVVREERRQRLGSSELVAQGSSIQPIGLPTAPGTREDTASLTPEQLKTLEELKRETALDDSQTFSLHPERMTEGSLGQEPRRVTLAMRTEFLNQKVLNLIDLIDLQKEQIDTLTENAGTNAPLNHGELAKESDLRALEKYVRFSRESELRPGQGNPKHPAELVSEMSESLRRDIEMAENRLEEKIQEANRSIQTLKKEIEALKKENQKLKE